MTRRERLEKKLEKRQEWAESRKAHAEQHFGTAHAATEHIPLGQPILVGHHSEKRHRAAIARSDSNMRAGCEDLDMAKHHEEKARGLEIQLDKAVFSDDVDAIAALEQRIAEREAKRDWMKKMNAAHKKFLKSPASLDASDLTDAEKKFVREYVPTYSWMPHPFPPYSMTNIGATIRTDKKRIEELKRRAERTEKAEANGGVTIERQGDYCRITFAEKPEREVLNALRAAGFHWGAGSWSGRFDAVPQIAELHFPKLPEGQGQVENS